jgi:hypothetical protein
MANLIIEVPDKLMRSLEGIAATHRMSIQQLALVARWSQMPPNRKPDPQPHSSA